MPGHSRDKTGAACRWGGVVAAALVGALAALPAVRGQDPQSRAAVLFTKDGFALKGYMKLDEDLVVDHSSHAIIKVPKGHYYLDDVARRIFFSHHYLEDTQKRPYDPGKEVRYPKTNLFLKPLPCPPVREVVEAGPWDAGWDRVYRFDSPVGRVKLKQHLTALTPQYAWVDALASSGPILWGSAYRTSELGREAVLGLLSTHPDLQDKPDLKEGERLERRFAVFSFLAQAGWWDEAARELDRVAKDFPAAKERVEAGRQSYQKLRGFAVWDEIKVAQAAGRHAAVRSLLEDLPTPGVDDKVLADVRALKADYRAAEESLVQARELLAALPGQVLEGSERSVFTRAAQAVSAELTYDHVLPKPGQERGSRLEPFLTQAARAAAAAKAGKAGPRPSELMSLAVTGWLLGGASAEGRPEQARRLWRARETILAYQRAAQPAARRQLLEDYKSQSGVSVEEVSQLIRHLPPPDPPEETGTRPTAVKASFPTGSRTRYVLQLPPEYHPGRSYPVLIALHNTGEHGRDMAARWAEGAARHGYVLAAPEWGSVGYSYSGEEHAAVLDTLRDLRQHYQVDSDRVFLTGFAEGANMAYDVAFSHPDLFAGVIPVSGQPRYHARLLWPNGRYLPVYTVWGEKMGSPDEPKNDGSAGNINLFREWIPGGYPAIGVQYKGRGLEWFAGELPDIFDWMGRKTRANPTARLGADSGGHATGGEMRTFRSGDDRFYWLGVGAMQRNRLNEGPSGGWDWRRSPVMLYGQIGEGNQIGVRVYGAREVTVWLTRAMIDFERPVRVQINLAVPAGWDKRKVEPSLETLLEDFYQRGDRQRLYIARLDFRV